MRRVNGRPSRRRGGEGSRGLERQPRRGCTWLPLFGGVLRPPQTPRGWRSGLALVLLLLPGCRREPAPGKDVVQEAFKDDALSAQEARGHRVFLGRCATCHGPQGRGDGQNAYNLQPPPPDFQESLAKLPIADRRRVIEGGTAALGRSPLCPAWGRSLGPDDVDALLAWLEAAERQRLERR